MIHFDSNLPVEAIPNAPHQEQREFKAVVDRFASGPETGVDPAGEAPTETAGQSRDSLAADEATGSNPAFDDPANYPDPIWL